MSRAVSRKVNPVKADLHRALQTLASEVAVRLWAVIAPHQPKVSQKLAKELSDAGRLTARLKDYYEIHLIDETDHTVPLNVVLQAIIDVFDSLSASASLIEDVLRGPMVQYLYLQPGEYIGIGGEHASAMANFEQGAQTLYIAAGRAVENIQSELKLGVGEHNVARGFKTVLSHEVGHAVMDSVERAAGKVIAIIFDSHPKEYWESKISKYAGTNSREMFAEAFAAWVHPEYPESKGLPPDMVAVFEAANIPCGVRKLAKAESDNTSVTTANGVVLSAADVASIIAVIGDANWALIQGVLTPAMLAQFKEAGYSEIAQMGFAGTEASDLTDVLDRDAVDWVNEHAADLVTQIEDTTRDQLRSTIRDALTEGWSKSELSDEVANSFAFSDVRSDMIAHTELAMAHSYGRVTVAKEAGAEKKKWLLSADHDPNEDCYCSDAADAGWVAIDDTFVDDDDYDFPPGHPNCVFEGSFVPYGELRQMVRSWYEGPAIELDIGGSPHTPPIQFKIGPNHPVLTRRGLVRAAELREGDEVLYDRRVEFNAFVGDNFKHIPSVSEAFETLIAVTPPTTVAGAAHYFHGDEEFIYGEIDVVRPTRALLPVFDSGGVKEFGEGAFTGRDMEAERVSRSRARQVRLNRIFSSTSSSPSGGHNFTTSFFTKCLPAVFRSVADQTRGVAKRFVSSLNSLSPLLWRESAPSGFHARRISSFTSSAGFRRNVGPVQPRSFGLFSPFTGLRIIGVHKVTYSGWCYDASTSSGLYSTSGIVAKNCWCDWTSDLNEDYGADDDLQSEDGEDWDGGDAGKVAKSSIDAAAHEAAASPRNSLPPPTDAQMSAGNYKKGHINVGGLDIAIENPFGSRRCPQWPKLAAHYGYVKRHEGADGDEVDVFVKPGTDENYKGPVFVIDQIKQDTGDFDEHKVMVGWNSHQEAVKAYLKSYQKGWKVGTVTRLPWKAFLQWLQDGDTSKPAAG